MMARATGEGSDPSGANPSRACTAGWAMIRGAVPGCGQVAVCTTNGWHKKHIPGLAGRVRDRPAQSRRPPELGIGAGACLTVRGQELRDMQMQSADQPGRRVVRADVGEQQQRQQRAPGTGR
jgi:hypothetical protein